jgi:hypothetical protein
MCREVKALRKSPVSERDAELNVGLAEHQRHCVSPDRLCEAVRRRVLFRPEHGERSHSYELLHSPRMFVVQDNVEVVEHRDAAVYSTVVETPSYRFTMETATDNRPGKKRPVICHFSLYVVIIRCLHGMHNNIYRDIVRPSVRMLQQKSRCTVMKSDIRATVNLYNLISCSW